MLHKTTSLHYLLQRWKIILFVGIIFAFIGAAVTLLFTLEYRADAEVLVISRSRFGVDPYTTVKSAERIGENVIQVMRTSDFYEKVKEQPDTNIDLSRFENITDRERRKRWEKTIEGSVLFGTGVIKVSAYHPEANQARNLAFAAANTLVSRGWEYVGGDVSFKVINNPVVSKFPVRPNIIVNAILGLIVGLIFMSLLVLRRG